MAEIIAVVEDDSLSNLTVTSSENTATLFTTSDLTNPAVLNTLDDVGDIDMTSEGKNDGSVLVYRTITNKWTATTTLDAQNMEGGEF
jgi:hypothetical protein